jgi:probable F420-dependent oxidoreductase
MKLSVEFPSIAYREGPSGVTRLMQAIERIGFDQLDVFDHVVMGYDHPSRESSRYPAPMPIIEALTTLSFAAAVTERIGLGTEVLVLPQRSPVLVAKQVSSIDTLSGGRMRLGVGVGWQPSEFEALGEDYSTRGRRMDEALQFLRSWWHEAEINYDTGQYRAVAMAMAPKPPQGAHLPIWIGGNSAPAFTRVGRYGDGWLASQVSDAAFARDAIEQIADAAQLAGRDPASIGLQSMIAPPPRSGDASAKQFYADHAAVVARVADLKAMGFQAAAINATAIFQAGARSVDAMIDALAAIHEKVTAATK